jgi:hypothetical protein
MGCGLGGFLGVEGLDTRFYGEIRGKNLRERAELEVDPPFARKKRRMGHPLFVGGSRFQKLRVGHPP